MILNYDQKNGFSSIFSKSVSDGEKTVKISQEIIDAFEKLDGQGKIIGASQQDAYDIAEGVGVANKAVVDFVREGKGGLKEYEAAMQSTSKQTTMFEKGLLSLKTIGGNLLSMAVNALASYAISWVLDKSINAIYNWINATEIAIEKGKEAQQTIAEIGENYENKKTTVNTNLDRYTELSKGVDNGSNTNISLTNDEYLEFLSISNQLADAFPELVVGWDSQGNALLSLSGDANETSNALNELLDQERQLADFKISQNLQTAFDGTIAQIGVLQKEIDSLNESIELYNSIGDTLSDTNNALTLSDFGFDTTEDTASIKKFAEYGDENAKEVINIMQGAFNKAVQDAGLEEGLNYSSMFSVDAQNNDKLGTEWVAQLYGLTKDQLKILTDSYKTYIKEMGGDLDDAVYDSFILKQQDTKEIQANWNSMVTSLITAMSVYDGYNELGDGIKQAINTGIGNIDPIQEWMDKNGRINAPDNIRAYLRKKFLDPITNVLENPDLTADDKQGFQDAIDGIFNIDTSNLTVDEYSKKIDEYLEQIKDKFDSEEEFYDFALTFGFKVKLDNGQIISSTDDLYRQISNEVSKRQDETFNDVDLSTITYDQLINIKETYTSSSNGKTFSEVVDDEIKKAQETIDSSDITFSSLFGEDSEISKKVDTFQSNISSIQEALEKLKSGDYTASDITDLIQQFPSLSTETDNLNSALNGLVVDNFVSAMNAIQDVMKGVTDPTQIAAMNAFSENLKKEFIGVLDANAINNADIKKTFRSLFPDVKDIYGYREEYQKNINQLISEFSGTEEGRAALLTLSAAIEIDPSIAYADYDTLKSYVEDNEIIAKLVFAEEDVVNLQNELKYLQDDATSLQDNINLKEAANIKISKSDYRELIENGNKQIKNLEQTNEKLEIQREGLDKTSDRWKSIQSEIDANDSSINAMIVSQLDWQKTIENLPISNVQALTSAISAAYNEANSVTGLTNDTMNSLLTQFSDLSGIDTSTLFYRSADGVKVNTDALQAFAKQEDKIVRNNFKSEIQRQEAAIKNYQDQIGKGATDTTLQNMENELQKLLNQRAQYFAEYKKQMEEFSKYNAISIAEGTENQGTKYDKMQSRLESWKSMYDKGLTGTDDFESIGEYFNKYGFGDVDSFEKDYAKATRYLTDDATGVQNFFSDLQSKGLATLQTLDDGTQALIMNFDDAAKAAFTMDIGEEFFTDMLGKSEEYGSGVTFITSIEDSVLQTEELNQKLYEAQKKYLELQKMGADDEALQKQQGVIDGIKTQLSDVDEVTQSYLDNEKQKYIDNFDSIKDTIKSFSDYRREALERGDNESAEKWVQDAQTLADEYGIELEVTATGLRLDEGEYQEKFNEWYSNKGTWEKPVLPSIGTGNHETYSNVLNTLREGHESENEVLENSLDILKKYTAEELKAINLNDGVYDSGKMKEAEMALDAIADEFGLTADQAKLLANVLEAVGETKIEPNFEGLDSETYYNGLEELQEMQNNGDFSVECDFTANTSELDLDDLEERLDQLETIKLDVEPGSDAASTIDALIDDTNLQIKIKTALEENPDVDELLNMTDEEIVETVKCDADEVDVVKQSLEEIKANAEIPITVKIDESQFEALTTNTTTANFDATDANTSISEYKKNLDSIPETAPDPATNVNADNSDANKKIADTKKKLEDLNSTTAKPTININNSVANSQINIIKNKLDELDGKTVTSYIKTVHQNVGSSNKASKASGTLTPAKASGTAYNMLNLRRAFVNGSRNVSLQNDEDALVNELGTEGLIRDGILYEIPGGMHVQALKKGDIILSVKQMHDLELTGKASGHGKAYADGTITSGMHAYNAGKLTIPPTSKASPTKTNNATNNNTTAVNKNTAAQKKATQTVTKGVKDLNSFQKWLEKLKDWIVIRVQRLNEKIDLNTTKSENAIGYQKKNSYLDIVQSTYKTLYDNQKSGENRYLQQADKVKENAIAAKLLNGKNKVERTKRADSIISKIQNGAIRIDEYGEKEREFISAYTEWYDKAMELRQSAEETLTNQMDNEKQKFDNIADEYDNVINHIEHNANLINEYRDQNESSGYVDSTKYYESLKSIEQDKINRLTEERKNLVASLKKSMDSGIIEKGDTRWYEMQSQINEVSESILESNGNIIEFQNSIREIEWDKFDKGRDAVKRLNDEFDFMIELMSDEKMYDEFGKITNEGMATLALQASNYNVHMEQANEYAREYQKLTKLINSNEDNKNNTTLLQRQQDLLDKWRDNLKDAESDVQSIKDTVQEGIDAELDALQKLIDKYNDALDDQKSLYDYQRNIKDQTSEVSKYQKQLNAYSNDMSEEGRLKYQQAQKNLKDAQENLKQSEYDRYISDQKDVLDELMKEYTDILNSRVDDTNLLLENVIKSANENKESITTTLEEQAGDVGYTMTEAITGVWGENGSATTILTTFSSDFSSKASALQNTIDQINKTVSDLYAKADKNAAEDIAEVNNTSTSGSNPQVNAPTPVPATPSQSASNNQANTKQEEKLGPVSGIQGTLKKGAKNKNVGEMQKALKKMGYKDQNGKALLIDNWFGPKTQYALKRFQKAMKISQTGILDAKTKEAFKKKGYAKGTDWIDEDELALTQEKGRELITFPDGSMLTPLKRGSGVINNPNTEKVLSLADNHDAIMEVVDFTNKMIASDQIKKANDAVQKIADSAVNNTYGGNINVTLDNITFNLPNVNKPEDFMNYMMSSRKVQLAMQEYILGEAFGRTPGATRNHRF